MPRSYYILVLTISVHFGKARFAISSDTALGPQGDKTHINYVKDFEFYRRLLAIGMQGSSTKRLLQVWNKAVFPNEVSDADGSLGDKDSAAEADESEALINAMANDTGFDSESEGERVESVSIGGG